VSWPWWAALLLASPWLLAGLGALILLLSGSAGKPNVRDWQPLHGDDCPSVSVIVPARNEAANIERCLRSLLATEYPEFEVIVVNDRSTDATAEIARRIAADDDRLVVIDGEERPADWAGKPWACWQGYRKAVGDILLFTDADTKHGPRLLGRSVAMLKDQHADMVTVMPLQEMKSFWERLVQPLFFLLLGLRFGSPARLNRNTNPRHAIANGQFILVTRDSYEWIGGHRKVRRSVVEDLDLAISYTATARVIRFAVAEQDMRTRMYDSLGALVEGWSKNMYLGMTRTFGSPALTFVAMTSSMAVQLLYFVLPFAALVAGLVLSNSFLIVFGATAWLSASLLIGAVLAPAGESMLWGLFHPLGGLVQVFIFARSLVRGRRNIVWKGRSYTA